MVIFEKMAEGMVHEVPEYMLLTLWDEMYDGAEDAIIRYADNDIVRPAKYLDGGGKKKAEDILSANGILPAIIHYANSVSLDGEPDVLSDDRESLFLQSDFKGLVIELDDNPVSSLALTGYLNVENGVATNLLYMRHAMESLIEAKRVRAGVIPDITGAINYSRELRKNMVNGIVDDPLFFAEKTFKDLEKGSKSAQEAKGLTI